MTISERFKQALQAGDFDTAIDLALSEAMNLEIVTWVADDADEGEDPANRKRSSQIRTNINLLDGKVENQIGSLFLDGGPYANLREFHTHQVQAGQELIRQKFASLQALRNAFTATKSEIEAVAPVNPAPLPQPHEEADLHHHTSVVSLPESLCSEPETSPVEMPVLTEPAEIHPTLEPFSLASHAPVNANVEVAQNGHAPAEDDLEITHIEVKSDQAISTTVDPIETIPSGFHSIETILSNLFTQAAEPILDEGLQNIPQTDVPQGENGTLPHSPSLSLAAPITPESVNLQIELSIDELLADLFYEDEDKIFPTPTLKTNGSDHHLSQQPSDPWGNKNNTSLDLNSFADNAPKPPKLSFDR